MFCYVTFCYVTLRYVMGGWIDWWMGWWRDQYIDGLMDGWRWFWPLSTKNNVSSHEHSRANASPPKVLLFRSECLRCQLKGITSFGFPHKVISSNGTCLSGIPSMSDLMAAQFPSAEGQDVLSANKMRHLHLTSQFGVKLNLHWTATVEQNSSVTQRIQNSNRCMLKTLQANWIRSLTCFTGYTCSPVNTNSYSCSLSLLTSII